MIVSLAAYARPEYLAETLAALRVAADELPEAVMLYAQLDPSPHTDEMYRMCADWGRGSWVFVNDEQKGCSGNTLLAVDGAFVLAEKFHEDYVQHLEEDFVFAPDALRLSAWIRDNYRADRSVLAGGVQTAHAATPDEYLQVHKSAHFHCQGWSTWADRFEQVLKPLWNAKLGERNLAGWAQNFNDRAFVAVNLPQEWRVPGLAKNYQVIPRLSRCKHIGLKGGLHTTPETFAKDYPQVFAGDVDIEGEYVALPGALPTVFSDGSVDSPA